MSVNVITQHLVTTVLADQYTAEPLGFTPHYPADLESDAVRRVFVTISGHGQIGHAHHFTDIDRFGDGLCHACGATGWCSGWVRKGVFDAGEGTASWIVSHVEHYVERAHDDQDDVAYLVAHELLGAEEITLTPLVAAETVGTDPAATRRPGIAVPTMALGVFE